MAEQALLEVEPNVLPPAVAEVQLFRCTLFMPHELLKERVRWTFKKETKSW